MTTAVIITICFLLLLAYVFDISSPLTKIPSVILLLLLGWVVKQGTYLLVIPVPDLNPLLPLLGTFGLILIVLEGALELELDESKIPTIKKSTLIALITMITLAVILAVAFQFFGHVSFKTGLINAIPFCVISSAIAIPSARNLSSSDKEFVIYESSLSDILGVLFFNFIVLNEYINGQSFGHFLFQIIIVVLISLVSVLGLSFLLSRIKHHITYTPIILLVILIYAITKVYHLPGLIFILVFGLFLGNIEKLKQISWIGRFYTGKMSTEVAKFKGITIEATFLVRALFFILFGFLMEASEILNLDTMPYAVAIVLAVGVVRWIALKISKIPFAPLLYIAPRGLITILLFLAIIPEHSIPFVNKALVIQTIILSVLAMMGGLMRSQKKELRSQVPTVEA